MYRAPPAFLPLFLHSCQVSAQGMPSAQMSLVRFQPNQTFHEHLVQCVVIFPQAWTKMTDSRIAIYVVACMIVVWVLVEIRSVVRSQHC